MLESGDGLLEIPCSWLGIDRGRIQPLMPQQRGDCPEIHPGFDQALAKGVAQGVRRHAFDSGQAGVLGDDVFNCPGGELPITTADKR